MNPIDYQNGINQADIQYRADRALDNLAANRSIAIAQADANNEAFKADKWRAYAHKLENKIQNLEQDNAKLEQSKKGLVNEITRLSNDKEALFWKSATATSTAQAALATVDAMHKEVVDAGLAGQLRLSGDSNALDTLFVSKKKKVDDEYFEIDRLHRAKGDMSHVR